MGWEIRRVVEWTLRGCQERECGRAFEPHPFVPSSILPGWGRFTKIKLHKFCQNDFSGVGGLFLLPQKKQQNRAAREKSSRPRTSRAENVRETTFSPRKAPHSRLKVPSMRRNLTLPTRNRKSPGHPLRSICFYRPACLFAAAALDFWSSALETSGLGVASPCSRPRIQRTPPSTELRNRLSVQVVSLCPRFV